MQGAAGRRGRYNFRGSRRSQLRKSYDSSTSTVLPASFASSWFSMTTNDHEQPEEDNGRAEDRAWSAFSLVQALRDVQDDEEPTYTEEDLTE